MTRNFATSRNELQHRESADVPNPVSPLPLKGAAYSYSPLSANDEDESFQNRISTIDIDNSPRRCCTPTTILHFADNGIELPPASPITSNSSNNNHHEKKELLANVPPELLDYILQFCDAVSLSKASQVSRYWNRLCYSEHLWKKFALNLFHIVNIQSIEDATTSDSDNESNDNSNSNTEEERTEGGNSSVATASKVKNDLKEARKLAKSIIQSRTQTYPEAKQHRDKLSYRIYFFNENEVAKYRRQLEISSQAEQHSKRFRERHRLALGAMRRPGSAFIFALLLFVALVFARALSFVLHTKGNDKRDDTDSKNDPWSPSSETFWTWKSVPWNSLCMAPFILFSMRVTWALLILFKYCVDHFLLSKRTNELLQQLSNPENNIEADLYLVRKQWMIHEVTWKKIKAFVHSETILGDLTANILLKEPSTLAITCVGLMFTTAFLVALPAAHCIAGLSWRDKGTTGDIWVLSLILGSIAVLTLCTASIWSFTLSYVFSSRQKNSQNDERPRERRNGLLASWFDDGLIFKKPKRVPQWLQGYKLRRIYNNYAMKLRWLVIPALVFTSQILLLLVTMHWRGSGQCSSNTGGASSADKLNNSLLRLVAKATDAIICSSWTVSLLPAILGALGFLIYMWLCFILDPWSKDKQSTETLYRVITDSYILRGYFQRGFVIESSLVIVTAIWQVLTFAALWDEWGIIGLVMKAMYKMKMINNDKFEVDNGRGSTLMVSLIPLWAGTLLTVFVFLLLKRKTHFGWLRKIASCCGRKTKDAARADLEGQPNMSA